MAGFRQKTSKYLKICIKQVLCVTKMRMKLFQTFNTWQEKISPPLIIFFNLESFQMVLKLLKNSRPGPNHSYYNVTVDGVSN